MNDTNPKNISRRGQVNKETYDKDLRTNFINSEFFEMDPLNQEKRKLFWSLSGILVKTYNDESDTSAPTDRHDFSVTKLAMNQTEDNQNGEKSVGFDGIWYSNQEDEVHTTRHNSTPSITSTENSDE